MFLDWNRSPKLDVGALALEGRELEIAQIIAEETEAQREIERGELPPATPEQLAAIVPGSGLLNLQETEAERRRRQIDSLTWDALLLRGGAHTRSAQRAAMELSAVISFAMDKCRPTNMDALFWYRQWVKEALSDKVPRETLNAVMEGAKREAAKQTGKDGADKRWAAYREAKTGTQQKWNEQKESYGGKKAPFARAIIPTVKQLFPGIDDITERTITEDWLKGL
jgi:hypothetical protein